MEEARKSFHKELNDIQQELVRISAGVVESIPKCTTVLLEQDLSAAEAMIMADDEVDARTIELEDRCIQILALQAPVAGELRQVIAALKICAEIERSADLVENIFWVLSNSTSTPVRRSLSGFTSVVKNAV